jgi:hypothetical protein
MSKINTKLGILLEDVKMSHEHHDSISATCEKIKMLEMQTKEARTELSQCVDSLCADLAKEIRRLQIDLNVTMNRSGCNVGYRAKYIPCNVMAFEKKWDFSGTDFGRIFMRRYPDCCDLNCSIPHLAKCLAEFFTNQYRSLIK